MKILTRKDIINNFNVLDDKDEEFISKDEVDNVFAEMIGYISAPFGKPEDKLTLLKETIKERWNKEESNER